jgi:SAM-dependent methyltransferase
MEYPIENNRRYAGSGPDAYFMPNDEAEQTRLNIVHQAYLMVLNGELTTAPVESPGCILDIGCGTGDWAIAMAELHPSAEVIGMDLSAIQPSAVPSNVFFEIDDAEAEDWTYSQPFDLIHIRNLSGSFLNWGDLYRQCYAYLNPGGYLEVSEIDYNQMMTHFSPDSHLVQLYVAVTDAATKSGRYRGRDHLKRDIFLAAGFKDITEHEHAIPLGIWPQDPGQKAIGKLWLIACLESLEALSLRLLTRESSWTAAEVREKCASACEELREASRVDGVESRVQFVVARRPFEEDGDA